MKKIVLYHPDEELKEKIKRLPKEEFQVIGTVDGQTDEIGFEDYDHICIPLSDYKQIKRRLGKTIDPSVIHTYEELRVLGAEQKINEYYMELWRQRHLAGGLQDFQDRPVLIFGGGSGLGYACAEAFASAGARVVIAGRNEEKLKRAVKELGQSTKYMIWDISKVRQDGEKLEEAIKLAGGRIEIVVNSAGVYDGDSLSFFDVTEETYDAVMETNLKGAYFLCRTFAGYFIEEMIRGHMVNIISETGNSPTVKPYGMSKWGLWGLTKGLGLNLAKYNITVNGVAPGEIATDMTGWGGNLSHEP